MSDMMAILLNGIAQLEYHRERPLNDFQRLYLEKMDSKMQAGIELGETLVATPDENQRLQFVAANLYHALMRKDEAMCSALCSYLAERQVQLKQVLFDDRTGEVSIELVFDRDYGKQVPVTFIKH
jgi:hypothetical protein